MHKVKFAATAVKIVYVPLKALLVPEMVTTWPAEKVLVAVIVATPAAQLAALMVFELSDVPAPIAVPVLVAANSGAAPPARTTLPVRLTLPVQVLLLLPMLLRAPSGRAPA